jgi:hypothetical protein
VRFNLGFTEDISRICKSRKKTVLWSGRKKGSKYSLGNLREREYKDKIKENRKRFDEKKEWNIRNSIY